MAALRNWGILCIGVYRYLDLRDKEGAATDRYAVTNPNNDFMLHPTDKIFVFEKLLVFLFISVTLIATTGTIYEFGCGV